jgi:predicted glycoside hydrolase/deacetylase ChbG (UPF0249 family)
MRALIVNGDDFGLAAGVNQGIIEAHTDGILTSTSLMVLRPAAVEAAELARAHPELSVGLHVDDAGESDLDDPRQTERAFAEQLERFRELVGRDPTHVDSHHHFHAHAGRLETFKRLVAPLGLPLRHDGRVSYIGGFWGQPDPDRVQLASLRRLIEREAHGAFSELCCHPARITADLRSSYLRERETELRTLTEPRLREQIEQGGVQLVSYYAWSN